MYYVYLDSPAGTELIGKGSLEKCKKIKNEKDKEWKIGYCWSTIISEKEEKEVYCWD